VLLFFGADFLDADFFGADFFDADFFDADFFDADFFDADFFDADFFDADLFDTDATDFRVDFGGMVIRTKREENVRAKYLCFSGRNDARNCSSHSPSENALGKIVFDGQVAKCL
jgi:uncharacterized protein YjbI with pentapeptide repeats